MSFNSSIESNNMTLEEILSTINNLPEKGGSSGENTTTCDTCAGFIDGTLTSCVNSTVTNIRDYAFINYPALESVSFPNVLNIGNYAFGAVTLTVIDVNMGNEEYFECNCSNLSSIDFPKAISIGRGAFSQCSGLTAASFPKVTELGDYAFAGCINLAEADFPSCENVGETAFIGCSNLYKVFLLGPEVCTLESVDAFSDTPFSSVADYGGSETGIMPYIYVPASLVDEYKASANWAPYSDCIRAMYNTENLISFTIEGVSYQAAEGMTWNDWVNSEYNTDGYQLILESDMPYLIYTADGLRYITADYGDIIADQERQFIKNGHAYGLY